MIAAIVREPRTSAARRPRPGRRGPRRAAAGRAAGGRRRHRRGRRRRRRAADRVGRGRRAGRPGRRRRLPQPVLAGGAPRRAAPAVLRGRAAPRDPGVLRPARAGLGPAVPRRPAGLRGRGRPRSPRRRAGWWRTSAAAPDGRCPRCGRPSGPPAPCWRWTSPRRCWRRPRRGPTPPGPGWWPPTASGCRSRTARWTACSRPATCRTCRTPVAALRELARVTRPGGLLALFHPVARAVLAGRHGRALAPTDRMAEARCGRCWRRPAAGRVLRGRGVLPGGRRAAALGACPCPVSCPRPRRRRRSCTPPGRRRRGGASAARMSVSRTARSARRPGATRRPRRRG